MFWFTAFAVMLLIIFCVKGQRSVATFFVSVAEPSEIGAKKQTSGADGNDQQLSPPPLSPNIKCYVFPRGDVTRFKPAR